MSATSLPANRDVRIAIVADFNGSKSHLAIEESLADSIRHQKLPATWKWIRTDAIGDSAKNLAGYDAIWAGPCSPYESFDGALAAIRYARENQIPFLGTCGGFQHAIIEYVRNVLGYTDADHEETAPHAKTHAITRLPCSLKYRDMPITFTPGTKLAAAYANPTSREEYICNFGVNPTFVPILKQHLHIAASDPEGEIRAIELPHHPFYIATLFLPQHWTCHQRVNPLINAFLRAAWRV